MLAGSRRALVGKGQNAAAPAWTPASPTTDGGVLPAHWYRSDDAYQDAGRTTPVASDGDVVGNWTDLAANADHASQATTGKKPTWQNGAGDQLNSHPVIRWDGIDDWLQATFTTGGTINQPATILVVAKLDALAVNDGAVHRLTSGDDISSRMILSTNTSPNPDSWAMYAGLFVNGSASDSNWNIWLAVFNGASSQFWHNGISEGSGNAGAFGEDKLSIGSNYTGGQNWLGDIAEVLVFSAGLSTADKNEVGNYLATRYGLSWTTI